MPARDPGIRRTQRMQMEQAGWQPLLLPPRLGPLPHDHTSAPQLLLPLLFALACVAIGFVLVAALGGASPW